jgi:hypothetical protein
MAREGDWSGAENEQEMVVTSAKDDREARDDRYLDNSER